MVMKTELKIGLKTMAIVAVVLIAAIAIGFRLSMSSVEQPDRDRATLPPPPSGAYPLTRVDYEFQANSKAGGTNAQDAEADIDLDVFIYDDTAAGGSVKGSDTNADLMRRNYLDCGNAKPVVWAAAGKINAVEEAWCKVNTYDFWSDSNFNGGNSENQITQEGVTQQKADLDDIDGTGTKEFSGVPGIVYLVTVVEEATTDDEDIVPGGFLFTSVKSVGGEQLQDSINDGAINAQISFDYWSDAGSASKLDYSGSCSDNQAHTGYSISTQWNGSIHSGLTTATTINLKCDLKVKVNKEGFGLVLRNDIRDSASQDSYLQLTPFGEDDGTESWVKYSVANLTGDVPYSTSDVATDQIIWSSSGACGVTLTDDSGSDAVKYGDEKLYGSGISGAVNKCFNSYGAYKNGVFGIWGETANDYFIIDLSITGMKVDYDASTSGTNEQVDSASASGGELIYQVQLVTTESTTDRIARYLN